MSQISVIKMRKPLMAHLLKRAALLCLLLVVCENARIKPKSGSELKRSTKEVSSNVGSAASITRSGATCSDRSCASESCVCWEDDICRNSDVFVENVRKCQECVVDSDCTGTASCLRYWAGSVEGKWCSDCGNAAMSTAALKCMRPCKNSRAGNQECLEVDCYEGLMGSAAGQDVTYTTGDCVCRCCNGQTPECVTDFNSEASLIMPIATSKCECTGSISETNDEELTGSDGDGELTGSDDGEELTDSDDGTEPLVVDCVETAWLKNNGFAHGILKERGVSKVWCIPGLPCATEGHLLAECDQYGSCELVPYSQVCREHDFGCFVSHRPVSRLSHSVDWASVRIRHRKAGMSLHLTSVSQHVRGVLYYVSRPIAVAASHLASRGYGGVCDAVLLAVLWLEEFVCDSFLYRMLVRQVKSVASMVSMLTTQSVFQNFRHY